MIKILKDINRKIEQAYKEVYGWNGLKVFIVYLVFFNWIYDIDMENNILELAVKLLVFIFVDALYAKPREQKQPNKKSNKLIQGYHWINDKLNQFNQMMFQLQGLKFVIAIVVAVYFATTKISTENKTLDVVISSMMVIATTMLFLKPYDSDVSKNRIFKRGNY